MNHITLLAQIPHLEPILVLRSLLDPEYCYEGDHYKVADTPSARQILFEGRVVLQACLHDTVRLKPVDPGAMPQDLHQLLLALGMNERREALADGGAIDLEEFDNRIVALDAAWCLVHRLPEHPENTHIELAQALVRLANAWASTRLALFESEGTNTANNVRLTRDMRRLEAEAADLVRAAGSPLARIEMHADPRGSALTITIRQPGDRCCVIELPPVGLAWAVAPTASGAASGPTRPGSGRAPRTQRFGPTCTPLAPAVLAALQGARVTKEEVRLGSQLPPKVYAQVNEILQELGGHWHTHRGVHVFENDPRDRLAQACATGWIRTRKDFEFFWTPDTLAIKAVRLAQLQRFDVVLEPSAGRGHLARHIVEMVGRSYLDCIELMPENARYLASQGYRVREKDFLSVPPKPTYDAVILNPPFSGDRDIVHVEHALGFLKPGGRLVAITSPRAVSASTTRQKAFLARLRELDAHIEDVAPGTFSEAGTDVASQLIALTLPGCAASVAPAATANVPDQLTLAL